MASCVYERMRIPVNSCIRELDRKGVGVRSLASVACPPEGRKHAFREFRRAVSCVIAIVKRK